MATKRPRGLTRQEKEEVQETASVVSLEWSDRASDTLQLASAQGRTRRTSRVRIQVSGRYELPRACDRPCAGRSRGGPARRHNAGPPSIRSVRGGALGVQAARSPNPIREQANRRRLGRYEGAVERSPRECRPWRPGSSHRGASASRTRTAVELGLGPSDRARRCGPAATSTGRRPGESSCAGRTCRAPGSGAGSTGSGAYAAGRASPDHARPCTVVRRQSRTRYRGGRSRNDAARGR